MSELLNMHELPITAQSLLVDNHSEQARRLRCEWFEAKVNGSLTATDSCSDARVSMTAAFNTPGIISLRSIASAHLRPDEDPFAWVYGHLATAGAVVLEHFDSEQLIPGKVPRGCGGLIEKGKVQGKTIKSKDIKTALDFVMSRIVHEDLAVQAIVSASRVSTHTKAPVLAAAIDHRTYRLYPLAVFAEDSFISPIKLGDILDYNPERIYANGIPCMDLLGIPSLFASLIRANIKQQKRLAGISHFFESQRVQNPHTVIISTEIRPAGIRYPEHYGNPNTGFIVRLPYKKAGGIHIEPSELNEVIAQAGYALGHATHATHGKAFKSTTNLLVETPDMGLSREITAEILRNDTVKDWRSQRNGQVLAAQVNSAVTSEIINL